MGPWEAKKLDARRHVPYKRKNARRARPAVNECPVD
jgi:hypothetical protein